MAILPTGTLPLMPHRILICDGNDYDVYILLTSLEAAGLLFEHIRARDGSEAFNFMSGTSEFDLVVLDYWLPNQSGLGLLQQLRQCGSFPQCPVVVFTSYAGRDHDALRALGVRAILEKPLSLEGYRQVAESLAKLCV